MPAAQAEHVAERARDAAALAAAHGLHHVGHLAVHLEELVDVLDPGARARRDALLAGGLQDVRVAALGRSHGIDDGALALEHPLVEIGVLELGLHLADARQHAEHAANPADLLHLGELVAQVLQVEPALAHLLDGAHRLFVVEVLGGLLDEGDDVAHAEDAARDARRVEFLERVHLLAGADELDRLAGHGPHGERRAAAGIAVHAGQHDAGDAETSVEGAGGVDRVLAGEGVGDEQNLVRVRRRLHVGGLAS